MQEGSRTSTLGLLAIRQDWYVFLVWLLIWSGRSLCAIACWLKCLKIFDFLGRIELARSVPLTITYKVSLARMKDVRTVMWIPAHHLFEPYPGIRCCGRFWT